MKLSREDLERMIKEETEDLLGEKANPDEFDPVRFPLKLSDVDPAAAEVAVTHGHSKFDQDPTDDEINVDYKPSGVAAVQDLSPSQSSMNIGKAMTFVLHMIDPTSKMEAGGDLGAFISSDKYIMDGHHRWIATAMVDPSQSVGGYDVDFPGEQLVAVLNAMTKGQFQVMKGKPASGGFEQFKEKPIRDMLTSMAKGGISQDTVPDTFKGWQGRTPEQVMKLLQDWTGKQGEDAVESAVTKMVNNLGGINMSTPSWAPARPDMPVIDEPDIPAAVNALEKGHVDVSPPWGKPEEDPVGQPPVAESRNLMSISKERLQEIIKEELQNRKR